MVPARRPSPGVHPPMSTSTVVLNGFLIQYRERTPAWYGASTRLATTPSRPSWAEAASTSESALPAPKAGGVITLALSRLNASRRSRRSPYGVDSSWSPSR